MPSSTSVKSQDLYLHLSSPPTGTDPALRWRGTLTEAEESADADRSVIAGAQSDLPIA